MDYFCVVSPSEGHPELVSGSLTRLKGHPELVSESLTRLKGHPELVSGSYASNPGIFLKGYFL
jgi:hypothetical protein